VYYDLAGTLPKSLSSITANDKLNEDFEMGATHMIIADSSLSAKDASAMLDEISKVDGVKMALGFDSLVGPGIPREFIPDDVKDVLINGDYQMMVVGSEYAVASDEVNAQCEEINNIIKKYDSSAMLIGEAPCTKDLIEITDEDFKTVSIVSIGAIFVIIALVFKSVSLPIILVAVIEFAIFINMGIPAYTHTTLPFIASIVIGTIQLGGRLCDSHDNKVQEASLQRSGQEGSDCDGASQLHPVDHCKRAQLLCSDLRCRHVFQY